MKWKDRDKIITVLALGVLTFTAFYMMRQEHKIVQPAPAPPPPTQQGQ